MDNNASWPDTVRRLKYPEEDDKYNFSQTDTQTMSINSIDSGWPLYYQFTASGVNLIFISLYTITTCSDSDSVLAFGATTTRMH